MSDSPKDQSPHTVADSEAIAPHLTVVGEAAFDDDGIMPWQASDGEEVVLHSQAIPVEDEIEVEAAAVSYRIRFGLTEKQSRFCAAIIRGVASNSDAYREAYDAGGMMPSSIHRRACELMSNGKITACLDYALAAKEAKALQSEGSRRSFVVERLGHEAVEAESDSARVAALVALGKSIAMFTDKTEAVEEDTRSASEIRQALEERLASMFKDTA